MKKVKLLVLVLSAMVISMFGVACSCNDDTQKDVKVERIYFTYNGSQISENGVEVEAGGKIELELNYEPQNAVNTNFSIIDYNEDLITVEQKKGTNIYKITAKSEFDESITFFETTLRVFVIDSDVVEPATCLVKVIRDYETLETPTGLGFDGEKLTWNSVSVDNFENYSVMVNDTEYTTVTPYLNFDDFGEYDKNLTVKVKANGIFDFYDSNYSSEYKFKKFSKVENVEIKNQIVSFDLKKDVLSYSLFINNLECRLGATQNQFDISEYVKDAGTYQIYVIANGNSNNKDFIEFSSNKSETITIKRLDVPKNFKLENNVLSWDAVDSALSYEITYKQKDGNDETLTTQYVQEVVGSYSYKLTDAFIEKLQNAEYEFVISAKGNSKDILDSGIGAISSVTKLETLTIDLKEMLIEKNGVSTNLNVVTWEKTSDNESYEILINNNTPIIVSNKNYIELDSSFNEGLYSIKVRLLGNGSSTLNGDYSKEISVRKLDAVKLQTFNYDADTGVVTFTSNYANNQDFEVLLNDTVVDYYEIEDWTSDVDNKDIKIGFNILNYVNKEGDYKVKVKVKNRNYQRNENDTTNFYGYTDSEYSQEFVITKLSKPTLTYDGENLKISSIVGAKSYDLMVYKVEKINNQDEKVLVGVSENLTSSKLLFSDIKFYKDNTLFNMQPGVTFIVVARLNGQSTNNYKTISSNESEDLKFQVLPAPTITINDVQEYINDNKYYKSTKFNIVKQEENASSYDYFITNVDNGNVEKIAKTTYESESGYRNFISKYANISYRKGFLVQAVANGKVAQGNDINYISSSKSESVKLYQLPVITVKNIENEKLIFNKITFDGVNSNEIQYSVKFSINNEVVYIDNNITFTTNNENEYLEYVIADAVNQIFKIQENGKLKYDLSSNNYTISVDVIANGNNSLLSNTVSSSLSFTKLKNPKITVTNLQDLKASGQTISEDNMSGKIVIEKVENALGYIIYPYLNGSVYGNPINIPSFNTNTYTYFYQDKNISGGEYTFKISALGNDGNILASDEISTTITKFSAPTVTIKDGVISWETSYNTGVNPDCIFAVKISSLNIEEQIYFPYKENDLKNISSAFDSIKKVNSMEFPDNLPSGEDYTVSVFAIPLNINKEFYIISDSTTVNNVTKLPTSSVAFIRDGKFYFSEVSGATGYTVKVNNVTYTLNVNNGSLTQDKDGAFELSKNNENLYTFNFVDLFGERSATYEIRVKALSSQLGVVNSSYTVAVNTTVLPTPFVSINNGIISYSKVVNASSYSIKIYTASYSNGAYQINNLIEEIEEENISVTTYDFVKQNMNGTWKYDSGYYLFKIVANGNGINYITKTNVSSDQNARYVYKLSSPKNLRIKEGKLAWSTDETVTSLQIYATNTSELKYTFSSTDKTYALDQRFASGEYSSMQLQLLGNNQYLNSNISDKIKISNNANKTYKLRTPQIYTNNGELYWNHGDNSKTMYYELKIGSQTYNVGNDYTLQIINDADNLKIQLYKIVNNQLVKDNDTALILSGSNNIQIRAVGSYDSNISGWYFTSDYSEYKVVSVLENVQDVKIIDGELVWTNPLSNSQVEGNLKLVYTVGDELEEQLVDINDLNTYHFVDANTYRVYFKNIGNTKSSTENNFTINSKISQIYNFTKIERPAKITSQLINMGTGSDVSVRLIIDTVENNLYKFVLNDDIVIYNGESNQIEVQIVAIEKTVNSETRLINALQVNGEIVKVNDLIYELDELYTIKAMYVGSTQDNLQTDTFYYLSSEYSDYLTGTIPSAPELVVEKALDDSNNSYYTGRVYWEPVTFNDGKEVVDSYLVTTYYSDKIYTVKSIENGTIKLIKDNQEYSFTEKDLITNNGFSKDEETITNTFINAQGSGTYIRFIKSLLTNSGSYSVSSICAFNYNVFSVGDGSQENPYIIDTVQQFENMQYNMQENVYYKLNNDLDFKDRYFVITGKEDDWFNANFDGNGKTINNISVNSVARDYVGLFGYTGKSAVIKNVKVVNFNTRTGYCVGGIVGYNQGTVENCYVDGQLGTNYSTLNFTVYNGGISGYNAGTITDCTSNVNVLTVSIKGDKSTYAGGISGCNSKDGTISNCINNGQIGNDKNASQIAGGIVGENSGKIDRCKNTNDVYAVSVTNAFNANVGGIVGRNNSTASIVDCLTNGNVSVYSEKTSAKLYAGGLVGYNNHGGIEKCIMAIKTDGQTLTVLGKTAESSNLGVGAFIGFNNDISVVKNLFIYNNITVTANNINIDKYVGIGQVFINQNFSNTYVVNDTTTIQKVLEDFNSGWTIENNIVDNNTSGVQI